MKELGTEALQQAPAVLRQRGEEEERRKTGALARPVAAGFADELRKLATELPDPLPMNRDTLRQALLTAGVIGLGSGLGYGAHRALKLLAKPYARPQASRLGKALAVGLPVVGGAATGFLYHEMQKQKKKLMEEAYREGQERRDREDR